MSIVALQSVTKEYASGESTIRVLDTVDLELSEGGIHVVTGASGSGKSTLLNLIGGLDRVSSGTIESCGYRVDSLSEDELTDYRSTSLGLIFQFHYLLKDFTAVENVMLPAFMRGQPRSDALARAEQLLGEVGLSERLHHFPSQLSGGERQRAALARALINNPRLLLADEPTGNLDAANSALVEEVLFSVVREHATTLVLVTHDERLSSRGEARYVLERGVLKPS